MPTNIGSGFGSGGGGGVCSSGNKNHVGHGHGHGQSVLGNGTTTSNGGGNNSANGSGNNSNSSSEKLTTQATRCDEAHIKTTGEDEDEDEGDGDEDEDEDEDETTAESPLLPIKEEQSVPSRVQHPASNPHISATPTQSYSALGTKAEAPHTPTVNECRRRSSLTLPPSPTAANNNTSSLNILDSEANNNNNNNNDDHNNYNNEEEFYTPLGGQTPNHKHTYDCKLYPHDTFARLEGKSARANSKMQSKVDAVGRITGQWGKWQLRTVLLIFLCKIPSSWFMACIIFTAPAPRHGEFFCKPPPELGAQNQTQWIKVSHPQKEEKEDQEFTIDFCNVYQDAQDHAHHYYNYEDSAQEPRVWEKPLHRNSNVIPCTEFQHESDYHSVVTQYDLVCSRDILVSVTQFFHLFGVLTGGILANHLLKYFSPRSVMLFGMITQIFCGNLTGHVASYELHVFFRCLSAVCCAQMYTAGGMIMSDITGGKYRTCVSTLFEQFWSIGVMMLPGVASFWSSWSHLYMAISWPTVILIYLWQWIPDSPRWMIERGRVQDAKKILLECAEMNGTRYNLPHDIDQQLELQAQTAMDAPPPAGWWTIWKGEKAVRHMICVHLAWSLYISVYYGCLLNIRSFSREHLYINTFVAGFSEMLGTFFGLYLIMNTTRKWLWAGIFNILAGFFAWCCWLVPKPGVVSLDANVAMLMCTAMVSKMAISTSLSILTTSTVELVSPEKRKITSFSTICWARFWLLGAPFIGSTVVIGQLIPQTSYTALAIIGGICMSLISSPRTHPISRPASPVSRGTQNMATQFTVIDGMDNKGYVPSSNSNTIYAANTFRKLTTPQSNLPPQLMPGIWTTKMNEDSAPM
ncbi:solute carrier family 22 member 3 isoform X1 [Drosophila sulfurigaster albostrigata]|uniref:solute carrier family 22 member 3 isoform X1 n=1 Tax=Drosophila sulfurigaster albostrigata TaxID=89887 RepID=UPI002D21DF21|nr:solute carrier family 22 member 3 isoform X1 [Drosophila sulfurigaster albostrigata]